MEFLVIIHRLIAVNWLLRLGGILLGHLWFESEGFEVARLRTQKLGRLRCLPELLHTFGVLNIFQTSATTAIRESSHPIQQCLRLDKGWLIPRCAQILFRVISVQRHQTRSLLHIVLLILLHNCAVVTLILVEIRIQIRLLGEHYLTLAILCRGGSQTSLLKITLCKTLLESICNKLLVMLSILLNFLLILFFEDAGDILGLVHNVLVRHHYTFFLAVVQFSFNLNKILRLLGLLLLLNFLWLKILFRWSYQF